MQKILRILWPLCQCKTMRMNLPGARTAPFSTIQWQFGLKNLKEKICVFKAHHQEPRNSRKQVVSLLEYRNLWAFQNLYVMLTSSFQPIFCTTQRTTKLVKLSLLYQCYCNLSYTSVFWYMWSLEVFLVEMEPSRGCLAEFLWKFLELFCECWRSTVENTWKV